MDEAGNKSEIEKKKGDWCPCIQERQLTRQKHEKGQRRYQTLQPGGEGGLPYE